MSFPKPLQNSNPDLRELTRFRGQVWFGKPGKFLLSFALRARNLRQSILMKTSFETRVSRMELGSFVDINILL